ncbi:MAG: UDP-N-acetylmuramate dehydrogenase [Candidatus Sungbacteria bacterium]|nr:UDP-N-acetylmuramate dehydrogenase [Candidatus Sungbacteria bacterium]
MPIKIQENVALAPYTIYKIGGPAKFFAEVRSSEELKEALKFAAEKNLPFFVLGAGSNVLVSDKGFDGLVIRMAGGEVKVDGDGLIVDAGAMMAQAVLKSAQAGLTGFEWAIGVPGTIGGSVRGNAGCFGSEMKDVVESVEVFDSKKATSYKLQATSCEFNYRDSVFKKHPEWIILSATLKLKKGDPKVIQGNIKKITVERTTKQDIGTRSCGCIFKNVSWSRKDIAKEKLLDRFPALAQFKDQASIPASFLIDSAGLKDRRVGHVFISPKHANYFVNEGGATAEEVLMLIAIAKDTVRRKYGISLEEEIQYLGL